MPLRRHGRALSAAGHGAAFLSGVLDLEMGHTRSMDARAGSLLRNDVVWNIETKRLPWKSVKNLTARGHWCCRTRKSPIRGTSNLHQPRNKALLSGGSELKKRRDGVGV